MSARSTFVPVVPPGHESVYAEWHLAPAVRLGDLLICSGVIGTRADGSVPDDFRDEVRQAFANLAEVLAAAGSSLAEVADLLTFHVDLPGQAASYMQVRDEVLAEPWPSWTAIGVTHVGGGLPGVRIEIRATAHSPAGA